MGRDPRPLLPEDKLEAILRSLADLLASAREERNSGEGTITIRWNRGEFVEVEERPSSRRL